MAEVKMNRWIREGKMTRITFSRELSMAFSQSDCSFCLEEFKSGEEIMKIVCEHVFHNTCFGNWVRLDRTVYRCPVCSRRIEEGVIHNDM